MLAMKKLGTFCVLGAGCLLVDIAYMVNGEDAEVSEIPWQVLHGDCGGTLIGPKWVLTAAHCPMKVGSRIDVGLSTRGSHGQYHQQFVANRFIVHPEYQPESRHMTYTPPKHDVALVELDREVTLSDGVGFAKLPEKSLESSLENFQTCVISGFGMLSGGPVGQPSQNLRKADVFIFSNAECKESNNNSSWISDDVVCALVTGHLNGTTAKIDSGALGGPLVCEDNGEWTIHGVASFTPAWAWGPLGVFSRAYEYLSWIQNYVAQPTEMPTIRPPGGVTDGAHLFGVQNIIFVCGLMWIVV